MTGRRVDRSGTRRLLAAHLAHRPAPMLALALLVAVLSFAAVAVPRAIAAADDAGLAYELGRLSATERDSRDEAFGPPQLGPGASDLDDDSAAVWGKFDAALAQVRAGLEEPLRGLLGDARYTVTVGPVPIADPPASVGQQELTIALDPRYADRVRFVEGSAPAPPTGDENGAPSGSAPLEIAVSTATAEALGRPVGSVWSAGFGTLATEVRLAGVFEAVDQADAAWEHVPSILDPQVVDDGNRPPTTTAIAFAHPLAHPLSESTGGRLTRLAVPTTTTWFPFDSDDLAAADAAEVLEQLRAFGAVGQQIGVTADGFGLLSLRFEVDVTTTLELAAQRSAAMRAVIAMIAAGPIGVAAAVLVLGARMVAERRRSAFRLLAARGADGRQRVALGAIEALVAGVPAALVGCLAAILVVAGPVVPAQFVGPALVVALPAVVLGVAAVRSDRRAERTDLGVRRGGRPRVILEVLVVGLAAVAAVSLVRRGLVTDATAGVDPLLAATPLLLAAAGSVAVLRLYPAPLTGVLARASRQPGLFGFLGAARAVRASSAGLVPVLALVVGVAVALSSAVLLSTLDDGVGTAARRAAGADVQARGIGFTAAQLDAAAQVDGVRAVTAVSAPAAVEFDIDGTRRSATVFLVDADALRDVQAGEPGLLPTGVDLTSGDDDRVPVLASAAIAEGIEGADEVRLGDALISVAGSVEGVTVFGGRENWIVVDRRFAASVTGADVLAPQTVLVDLADGGDTADIAPAVIATTDIAARVADALGGAAISTPKAQEAQVRASPTIIAVQIALAAAVAAVALFGALAVVLTLLLGAADRQRLLAMLGTLGAPRAVGARLVAWEIVPPALAAVVGGAMLGLVLPLLVLAGVDLRGFTGGGAQPGYTADPAALALALVAFTAITAALAGVAAAAARRSRAVELLRTVEDR